MPSQFPVHPSVTLTQAIVWLRARASTTGATCPCCKQFAKVYRRQITSSSARALIAIYRVGGTQDFVRISTVLHGKRADEAKLRYWGLIEEEDVSRPDGGRAGYWRVTPLGEAWVLGMRAVPRYVRIYDGRYLGVDGTETVTVGEALGKNFDLKELMAGR